MPSTTGPVAVDMLPSLGILKAYSTPRRRETFIPVCIVEKLELLLPGSIHRSQANNSRLLSWKVIFSGTYINRHV